MISPFPGGRKNPEDNLKERRIVANSKQIRRDDKLFFRQSAVFVVAKGAIRPINSMNQHFRSFSIDFYFLSFQNEFTLGVEIAIVIVSVTVLFVWQRNKRQRRKPLSNEVILRAQFTGMNRYSNVFLGF